MPASLIDVEDFRDGDVHRAIFRKSYWVQFHLQVPMLQERERYLAFVVANGRSKMHASVVAASLSHVVRHLNLPRDGQITEEEIKDAAQRWLCESPRAPYRRTQTKPFESAARSFLGFLGQYTSVVNIPDHFLPLYTEFDRWLTTESRYLTSTTNGVKASTRSLFQWLGQKGLTLIDTDIGRVETFLTERKANGWKQRTVIGACGHLRILFAYLEERQLIQHSVSRLIEPPKRKFAPIAPKRPPWKQIRKLIHSLDRTIPTQCRARAILILASVYGFRKSEIERLTLDDLDWAAGTITVCRSKNRRIQQFPIQPELKDALEQYIHRVRPPCEYRNLFITLVTPYRPAANIGAAMTKVMDATQIFDERFGLHSLRHACATELLRQGTSLRGIADFLGHKSLSSVGIYAHCDSRALRKVGNFSLEQVL